MRLKRITEYGLQSKGMHKRTRRSRAPTRGRSPREATRAARGAAPTSATQLRGEDELGDWQAFGQRDFNADCLFSLQGGDA